MTNHNEEKVRSRGERSSNDILAGFLIGLITALPILAFLYVGAFEQIKTGARVAAIAAVGGGLVAVLVLFSLRSIMRKIFGHNAPSARTVFDEFSLAARAVENNELDSARAHSGRAVSGVLSIYAWLTARQWVTSLFLGAIALFAGSASTYILFEQTELIRTQSEILTRQEKYLEVQSQFMRDAMLSQDALRYVPLYNELTVVLSDIQIEASERGEEEPFKLIRLSEGLSARVVALSRSFRPYWLYDSFSNFSRERLLASGSNDERSGAGARLPMVFLSPERGMLLKSLLENRVELFEPAQADFRYSDMRSFPFGGSQPSRKDGRPPPHFSTECIHAQSPAFMYSGESISPPVTFYVADQHKAAISKYLETARSDAIYKRSLRQYNIESSDFSYSYLIGISLKDLNSSLNFEGSTLIAVDIEVRERLNLDGARIISASLITPILGNNPEVFARNAVFDNGFCQMPEGTDIFSFPSVSEDTVASLGDLKIISRVRIHNQYMTRDARAMAERNTLGHRS